MYVSVMLSIVLLLRRSALTNCRRRSCCSGVFASKIGALLHNESLPLPQKALVHVSYEERHLTILSGGPTHLYRIVVTLELDLTGEELRHDDGADVLAGLVQQKVVLLMRPTSWAEL